jgi:hypothetical protein
MHTLLTSARLRTQSATSSGCFFQGEDMAMAIAVVNVALLCQGSCRYSDSEKRFGSEEA